MRAVALHGLERSVLRALNAAEHHAVVLLREEALGDDTEKIDVDRDGDAENRQRQRRVLDSTRQSVRS